MRACIRALHRLVCGNALTSIVAVALCGEVSATTILYRSLDDLVREAEAVVVAAVTEVRASRGADGKTFTLVTVVVVDGAKGNLRGAVTFRVFGGSVDGQTLRVVGAPELVQGDELVLFVAGNGRYMVPFVGWTQGVFRLTRDGADGEPRVLDYSRREVMGLRDGHLIVNHRGNGRREAGADVVSRAQVATMHGHANEIDSPIGLNKPTGQVQAISLSTFLEEIRSLHVRQRMSVVTPLSRDE